jgi:predicted nucleic acid-binding Zn finger protein
MSQTNASDFDTVLRDLVIRVATNKAQCHLKNARAAMNVLGQYLINTFEEEQLEEEQLEEEPIDQSASQYILSCVEKINLVCRELTAALQFDNHHGAVNPSRLLRQLTAAADLVTLFLVHAYPTHCLPRIGIQYINTLGHHYVKVVLEKLPSVKFLKVIVVTHDDSVLEENSSCDCPICYESVAATGTIYTNCHHGFCITCIKGLITSVGMSAKEKKPVCPMCRVEIKDLKIGSLEVFNEVQNHLSML